MNNNTVYFLLFLTFMAGTAVGKISSLIREEKKAPSKVELLLLMKALAHWAEKYKEAKPEGRRATRREADLFEAVCKVGIMWLEKPKNWD